MKRVKYDSMTPTTFEEHLDFTWDTPYTVRLKRFQIEDIVPLHHASTIEILVCDHLCGELTIANRIYELGGTQVFVITPHTVHSNIIHVCDGTEYVIKVDFEAMGQFVNLHNIFKYEDQAIELLEEQCPAYDDVFAIVQNLITGDDNKFFCLSQIIALFDVLRRYCLPQPTGSKADRSLEYSNLRALIIWTQEHYKERILIEDAAKQVGYSKFHFCYYFKTLTGTTYLKYLNSVRISHACRFLQEGRTVWESGELCGFESQSYFIKLFKKLHGLTPKAYVNEFRRINPHATHE
jgi:AraC-like DNA-binding protein